MHATLDAVLDRIELADDLSAGDRELARRLAGEWTCYGVGALSRGVFDGPSGRRLARMACEDVEGARRFASCVVERRVAIEVTEEVEDPPAAEGGEPVKRTVTRTEEKVLPPRVLEISDGHGMVSLVLALALPAFRFIVHDNDLRRRWLWQRMALSFGVRNLELLPLHARIAPGEWDVVLVKDEAPAKAMDLAGSLLAEGGNLLLWQDRQHAKGLRRRHLDARSRALRLAEAIALESPAAAGRLVARIHSPTDGLDSAGGEA